jgi:hypothetical protein
MYLDKLYSAAFTGLLYDAAAYKLLLQFVAGITSGSFDIYPNNEFTGLNMPVATNSFDNLGFKALVETGQSGGAMAQLEKNVATHYLDLKGFTRIICSHKPQGYVGVKVKFGDQLYYCVDVSKIDEQKYNVKTRYGCCFLVIDLTKPNTKPDDMLIGRIMLSQSQFPSNYNPFSPAINPSPFAQNANLFVNYKQSPVIESVLGNWITGTNEPVVHGTFPQNMQLTYNGTVYDFSFKNGPNFMKKPLLAVAAPVAAPVAPPMPLAAPAPEVAAPLADAPMPLAAAAPVPVVAADAAHNMGGGSRTRKRRHPKRRGRGTRRPH